MDETPSVKLFRNIIATVASVIAILTGLFHSEPLLRWIIISICILIIITILFLHYFSQKKVIYLFIIIGVLIVAFLGSVIPQIMNASATSGTATTSSPPSPTTPTPSPTTPTPSPTTPTPTPTTPTPSPTTPTPSPTTPTPSPTTTPSPAPKISSMFKKWTRSEGYNYIYCGYKPDKSPILWRILSIDPKCAILLSEKIQTSRQFDKDSSDWGTSSLCKWLNTDFLNQTFNEKEIELLRQLDGNNLVTIPTKNDLMNYEYGFTSESTDINRATGADSGFDNTTLDFDENNLASYFTRTPWGDQTVSIVKSTGTLGVNFVMRKGIGIRPMIGVDAENLFYVSGAGTKDNPYIVTVSQE